MAPVTLLLPAERRVITIYNMTFIGLQKLTTV